MPKDLPDFAQNFPRSYPDFAQKMPAVPKTPRHELRLISSSGINLCLSGLAVLTPAPGALHGHEGSFYRYSIMFWGDQNTRLTSVDCMLELQKDGFSSAGAPDLYAEWMDDTRDCYITGREFVPDSFFYTRTERFGTNRELTDRVKSRGSGATCILELRNRTEILELSEFLHDLREKRGNRLLLIVWERIPGIRNSSERFLMSSGASFIFPADTRPIYMNVMLETLRLHPWVGNVTRYRELVAEYSELSDISSGYKTPQEFTRLVTMILHSSGDTRQLQNSSVLICLVCRRGITPKIAASLFHPLRSGDICTTSANGLLVFLSSCSLHEIDTTLDRVFSEPVDKIFRRSHQEPSPLKIMQILRELNDRGGLSALELEYVRVSERRLSQLQKLRNGMSSVSTMANTRPATITRADLVGLFPPGKA